MSQQYKIIYEKRIAKDIEKIPHADVTRIVEKIHALAREEQGMDIKKLKGYVDSLYRLRVGDYRVIYEKRNYELIILVLQVGHRKEIYM